MNTGVRVYLESLGSHISEPPMQVEVISSALDSVAKQWLDTKEHRLFEVEPGVYAVRATAPSGTVVEKVVEVLEGQIADCRMPVYAISPHEEQEWAYFTQTLGGMTSESLSQKRYEGVWMRLWERAGDGQWQVTPPAIRPDRDIRREEDGVTYTFMLPKDDHFYALQVGGPKIPWKFVAIPSTYRTKVLVRPSLGPVGRVHPLDVVVSSEDLQLESLLALIQRGDLADASSLVQERDLAERFLFAKGIDTAAAAVGGYFLLRVHDHVHLYDWAQNLANWFTWLPDGPIIHAWQLIQQYRENGSQSESLLDQASGRLIEAVQRGFPLYTEGLRLLREGLILFDQRARGEDSEIQKAIVQMSDYVDAADWSVTSTTFLGERPDLPSLKEKQGTPRDKKHMMYVFDVPLREALRLGVLEDGDELIADLPELGTTSTTIDEKGQLVLRDGRTFKSLGALQEDLTGEAMDAIKRWRMAKDNQPLDDILDNLRKPLTY